MFLHAQCLSAILCILGLANGAVHCTNCTVKLYLKIYQANQTTADHSKLSDVAKGKLSHVFMKRWTMLHTDLNAVGFILHLKCQLFLKYKYQQVMDGFKSMIECTNPNNLAALVKAMEQHATYWAGMNEFWVWYAESDVKLMVCMCSLHSNIQAYCFTQCRFSLMVVLLI